VRGIRPGAAQGDQAGALLDGDEDPWLGVLGRLRAASGVQDGFDRLRGQRAVSELTYGSFWRSSGDFHWASWGFTAGRVGGARAEPGGSLALFGRNKTAGTPGVRAARPASSPSEDGEAPNPKDLTAPELRAPSCRPGSHQIGERSQRKLLDQRC
jgi:hypothetical protein